MSDSREVFTKTNLESMIKIFPSIDLDSIVSDDVNPDYSSLSTALFFAAADAESKGDDIQNKILSLLYEACHTRLQIENPYNPFDDNFTDSEIDFFAAIVKQIDNPLIKARLSDRVWNSPRHRNIGFALLAIDTYTSAPLDFDTWYGEGERCWQRAINLCLLIGKGAGDRLEKIEDKVFDTLMSTTTQHRFFGHSLANVLQTIDVIQNRQVRVAEKLKSSADKFDTLEDYYTSGRYFNASHKWFVKSELEERAFDMKAEEAKAFEKEAMARLESDDPSHLVAVGLLKDAVQTYTEIPGAFRDSHDVDQQIKELTLRIGEFGKLSLDEMIKYTTPKIDVTNSVEQARQYVSGKPIFDAFVLFTSIHHIDFARLRELAIENLTGSVVRRLFPTMFVGHDGRVVEKTTGLVESASSIENEDAISAEMNHFFFRPSVTVAVHALILPALWVLNQEHYFKEIDLAELSRRSPIVPRGREALWGKALFQGFNHDFISSVHILAPQIEHLVRFHLKANNVVTTFIDHRAGGRETENGLSALMKLPKTKDIFGENLSCEIKTLFCDFTGPNLRNDIAHGLLDDQQLTSVYSVYAWWFGLKLVVRSLLPPPQPDETYSKRD